MRASSTSRRIFALAIAAGLLAIGAWWVLHERLWREHPQPQWILAKDGEAFGATQFKYLSLGSEQNAGIPYWVFYVLPIMFPEKLPSIGGYGSFDFPWEQGVELPIGMIKRVIGYPRVGINCALCHTARYRLAVDTKPTFVPAGPGNTVRAEALSRFLHESAKDPRFNADNILGEMANFTKLGWIDKLLYRFWIIPQTRVRLIEGGPGVLWNYRDNPVWGRGSDGPTYWSKYLPDGPRADRHFGSSQIPAVWNLAKYQTLNSRGEPQRLMVTGEGRDVATVVTDSIAGLLGPRPHDAAGLEKDARRLTEFLMRTPAPAFPRDRHNPVVPEKISAGEAVFQRACAACHGKDSAMLGRVMPLAQVQTDPAYALERSKGGAADRTIGYVVPHLDGIWLRAPYLHNGSVPTIRDLLAPARQRPAHFYRGCDVLDSKDLGFVSRDQGGVVAKRCGTPFNTSETGNGNQGHEYGTELSTDEKDSLVEFMKTL